MSETKMPCPTSACLPSMIIIPKLAFPCSEWQWDDIILKTFVSIACVLLSSTRWCIVAVVDCAWWLCLVLGTREGGCCASRNLPDGSQTFLIVTRRTFLKLANASSLEISTGNCVTGFTASSSIACLRLKKWERKFQKSFQLSQAMNTEWAFYASSHLKIIIWRIVPGRPLIIAVLCSVEKQFPIHYSHHIKSSQ